MAEAKKLKIIVCLPSLGPQVGRRVAVPFAPSRTVAELADEIARRHNPGEGNRYDLSLEGGVQLFSSDEIGDVVEAEDTVYATTVNDSTPQTARSIPASTYTDNFDSTFGEPGDVKRVVLSFISPEVAKNGGKGASGGVLGFEGKPVSVGLHMDVIRQEAARGLGWSTDEDEEDEEIDDSPAESTHPPDCCSCLETNNIKEKTVEYLHCPRQVDGSICDFKQCPYGHTVIQELAGKKPNMSTSTIGDKPSDLECKICTELLGFPCPICIKDGRLGNPENATEPQDIMHCPLIQNAGCGHLFHAHCYHAGVGDYFGERRCPAGCPIASIGHEAVPFEEKAPHFVVVHSGSIIEKVPVALTDGMVLGEAIEMKDSKIVEMMQDRYKHLGPGLIVRMFDRSNQGTVKFRHSTTISICSASRHAKADGIIRFRINGPAPEGKSSGPKVDFHTASFPICNVRSGLSIEDLGLDDNIPNGGILKLFVVRKNSALSDSADVAAHRAAVYVTKRDWHPFIEQSDRGMAAFLSSLYVFINSLSKNPKQADFVLRYCLALTRFPPAVRTLHILMQNASALPQEIRALSSCIFTLAQDFVPFSVTKSNPARCFEGARIVLGTLIRLAENHQLIAGIEGIVADELFSDVALSCHLTGELLRNPVTFRTMTVEKAAAELRTEGNPLFDPSAGSTIVGDAPRHLVSLLRCSAGFTRKVTVLNADAKIPRLSSSKLILDFYEATKLVNETDLKMIAPGSLTSVITPAMTLDEVAFNAVYIAAAACGDKERFLRPCHGGDTAVDINIIASRLEPLIKQRQAIGEWEVDAFAGANSERVDPREVEEAIVIALDVSSSMNSVFNSAEVADEDEIDHDDVARDNVLQAIRERPQDNDILFEQAFTLIKSLDFIPNLRRYIYGRDLLYGETSLYRAEINFGDHRALNRRAEEALDQLEVLFTRIHWQETQEPESSGSSLELEDIEDFVAAIQDPHLKQQLSKALIELAAEPTASVGRGSSGRIEVPQRFVCPLSGEIFVDPVTMNDGRTYERKLIDIWRKQHANRSPVYPGFVLRDPVIPAVPLKIEIERFRQEHDLRGVSQPFGRPRLIKLGPELSYVPLPRDQSILAILFDLWAFGLEVPIETTIWTDVQDTGDGRSTGDPLSPERHLSSVRSDREKLLPGDDSSPVVDVYDFDCQMYRYQPTDDEREREESKSLTRIDVIKQAFEALVDKFNALDFPIALGLITFGKNIQIKQEITMLKEDFRQALRNVHAQGDTPLFDCLSSCCSMLGEYAKKHTTAKLRIICLTDGLDQGSSKRSLAVATELRGSNIVVDSIIVHSAQPNLELHAISVVTGGYSLKADDLETALGIVELETVLRSRDRIPRPPKPILDFWSYRNLTRFPRDEFSANRVPERKPHEKMGQKVSPAIRLATRDPASFSSDRQKRLMQELRDVVNSPHPYVDVYAGDDLSFWKIAIEAPEGPYQGGIFLVYVDFGEDYPRVAPEIRFVTPILHPNINRHGRVCHSALSRSWLSNMSMTTVFQVLYGLLLTPDTSNPLDLHATMEYNDDTGQHAFKIHNMVKAHASKSRAEWRRELLGPDTMEVDA